MTSSECARVRAALLLCAAIELLVQMKCDERVYEWGGMAAVSLTKYCGLVCAKG